MDDGETMVGNPLKTCEQTIGGSAEENNIQNVGRHPPTQVVETTGMRHEKDNVQPMDKTHKGNGGSPSRHSLRRTTFQPGSGRVHDYCSPTGGKQRYVNPANLSLATHKRSVHVQELLEPSFTVLR